MMGLFEDIRLGEEDKKIDLFLKDTQIDVRNYLQTIDSRTTIGTFKKWLLWLIENKEQIASGLADNDRNQAISDYLADGEVLSEDKRRGGGRTVIELAFSAGYKAATKDEDNE